MISGRVRSWVSVTVLYRIIKSESTVALERNEMKKQAEKDVALQTNFHKHLSGLTGSVSEICTPLEINPLSHTDTHIHIHTDIISPCIFSLISIAAPDSCAALLLPWKLGSILSSSRSITIDLLV